MTEDKLRGCLYGAAAGDALMFPYEGHSPIYTESLGREAVGAYKRHRSGRYPAGQVTWAVQLALAVGDAVSEGGPGVSAELVGSYLFPLARDRVLVAPPDGLIDALEAWARGRPGRGRDGAEAPIHLLPFVLADPEGDEQTDRALVAAARLTGHDVPEALALGAAFFSSVRYSLAAAEIVLGDLLDRARGGAARYADAIAEDLNAVPDLLCLSERDGIGPLAEEVSSAAAFPVLAGLISFLKSPYDCERSFLIAQRSGAGCVAGFVAGALGGAFNGESRIPEALKEAMVVRDEIERSAGALIGAGET
jgi:ADP-ribosylglycohydrolase